MGYSTEFSGSFELSPKATPEQIAYINEFSNSRRMKRDSSILQKIYQGKHGLDGEYGIEGEFFALQVNNFGQTEDDSVLDGNHPPSTQPGLWCQWELSVDGSKLEWNTAEKFYNYTEWLEYLIKSFFLKWGIELNGQVKWQGEDMDDRGLINICGNEVTTTVLE